MPALAHGKANGGWPAVTSADIFRVPGVRHSANSQWRSQEFVAGYAKHKKIEINTQYNERLSYTGHNKSIIITCGGLLRAGVGALALGRRGGCGLPLAELPLPRWGGREVGDELPDAGLGTGGGLRAESRGSEAHWGGHEARGTGASRKERERERFFCILGFFVGLC